MMIVQCFLMNTATIKRVDVIKDERYGDTTKLTSKYAETKFLLRTFEELLKFDVTVRGA
jgi:hypothetical protein